MQQSVSANHKYNEDTLKKEYTKKIMSVGTNLMNKLNYGIQANIKYYDVIKAKHLLGFDNNLAIIRNICVN